MNREEVIEGLVEILSPEDVNLADVCALEKALSIRFPHDPYLVKMLVMIVEEGYLKKICRDANQGMVYPRFYGKIINYEF